MAELPGQDIGAADHLVQRALAEDHAEPAALVQHGLSAHRLSRHGVLLLLVGHVTRLGGGDGTGVLIGLQQVGHELGLVGHDL